MYVTIAIKQKNKWLGLAQINGRCLADAGSKLVALGYPNHWNPGIKIDWTDTFTKQKNYIQSKDYKILD
jgi:hypothetical protein